METGWRLDDVRVFIDLFGERFFGEENAGRMGGERCILNEKHTVLTLSEKKMYS